MLNSFGSKITQKIREGERVKGFPREFQEIARSKLRMFNNSQNLTDRMIPPSNRLEKLKGSLKNYYSIRVNDQWRIIFKWNDGNSDQVESIHYHLTLLK